MKKILLLTLILTIGLTACGAKAPATPLPTVVIDNNGAASAAPAAQVASTGGVGASGIVVPGQEAKMAFTVPGQVKTVNVAEGDQVKAGDVLAELDNALLQLEVDQAERALKELTSPTAIAAAEQAAANAQKTLETAQDKADSLTFRRASDELVDNTKGEIDLARQALTRASAVYKSVAGLPDGDSKKAAALVAMTNAQMYLNSLIANYNWYIGTPTETDAAIIRANLAAAQATLQETQWYLAALKGEQLPPEATGPSLTRLAQTRDALKSAQVRLANTRIVSPISGTVTLVNIGAGEFANPGVTVFIISDVQNLRVETTDLSERDVPKVQVGQSVSISVEALNTDMTGQVILISPVATTLGGDVVYKTVITIDEPLPGLLAGMSVEVQYGK